MAHIIDTVILRLLSFVHPQGINILLGTLDTHIAYCPQEVYNCDESSLPLNAPDESLSELARGIRFAQSQSGSQPYRTWLQNAVQITEHLEQGNLVIQALTLEELERRDALQEQYGIGKGEAACLILCERDQGLVIFLSSDRKACKVAQELNIKYLTLIDLLEMWIRNQQPTIEEFDNLIEAMAQARFRLSRIEVDRIRNQLIL